MLRRAQSPPEKYLPKHCRGIHINHVFKACTKPSREMPSKSWAFAQHCLHMIKSWMQSKRVVHLLFWCIQHIPKYFAILSSTKAKNSNFAPVFHFSWCLEHLFPMLIPPYCLHNLKYSSKCWFNQISVFKAIIADLIQTLLCMKTELDQDCIFAAYIHCSHPVTF